MRISLLGNVSLSLILFWWPNLPFKQVSASVQELVAGASFSCSSQDVISDDPAGLYIYENGWKTVPVTCWGAADIPLPPDINADFGLVAAKDHVCGFPNGLLTCYSNNPQLDNSSIPRSELGNVYAVAVGGFQTCVIHGEHFTISKLKCFGVAQFDSLAPFPSEFFPTNIATSQTGTHSCALGYKNASSEEIDLDIICWGCSTPESSPVCNQIPEPATTVKYSVFNSIAVGRAHACAIRYDEQIVCWGDNTHGQLNVPQDAPLSGLVAGDDYTCTVTTNQRPFHITCWGRDDTGVLNIPPHVQGNALSISAGAAHMCATYQPPSMITGQYTSYAFGTCWGQNSNGQVSPAPDFLSAKVPPSLSSTTTRSVLSRSIRLQTIIGMALAITVFYLG